MATMLAPGANQQFIAKSGTVYTSSAAGVVLAVAGIDVPDLEAAGCIVGSPRIKTTSVSSGNGVLAAASMTGADEVHYQTSGATALTTDTAAAIIAALQNAQIGQPYVLRVYNTNAGTLTLTGGTGVTITGTATIATNIWREYMVVNNGTTITMTNLGAGAAT